MRRQSGEPAAEGDAEVEGERTEVEKDIVWRQGLGAVLHAHLHADVDGDEDAEADP